jgi:hypothetical protein
MRYWHTLKKCDIIGLVFRAKEGCAGQRLMITCAYRREIGAANTLTCREEKIHMAHGEAIRVPFPSLHDKIHFRV